MEEQFFGLNFRGLDLNEVLTLTDDIKFIVTVNAEFIIAAHKDDEFKCIINSNFATLDGQIPFYFAKKKTDKRIEKISGSDLIFNVVSNARPEHRIFLLGDKPEHNAAAVSVAKEQYHADCYGYSPDFEPFPFSASTNEKILAEIEKVKPTYLFVAFGAKKQEFWIHQNLASLKLMGVKWVVGCGGSISFLSGNVKRAPKLAQRLGLESVFRFFQEPKMFRLMRIIKSFEFFKYIHK
ncbi:WecB/TagA/CpsF family glycosyltransferase [Pseudoalteromonas sp. JBTF-M23]|uniref:WecB/TagA/CpsF family glycosyltransferase n=1 Tax=Pseudoalteromonas caenipelagi TaxID=2726988 RepID=A0A849VDM2_9GAMM|nr:WecB/TagA/CpsF family glycosyltransferase [Pseudoalteromonas caenipelagi]NOU51789.1 WecB/TagA/CpsF family glycosyltransferase [Pseudoalteromonas caenipelagi]